MKSNWKEKSQLTEPRLNQLLSFMNTKLSEIITSKNINKTKLKVTAINTMGMSFDPLWPINLPKKLQTVKLIKGRNIILKYTIN